MSRWIKARGYPLLPSIFPHWHEKRRKGLLYRCFPADGLECQKEQDRIFWNLFLHPPRTGTFLEVGGDGVTGSHTLGLELWHGWEGELVVEGERPAKRARRMRTCRISDTDQEEFKRRPLDLLAIHQPAEFSRILEALGKKQLRPGWVIVENREPDPQWCRWLERSGYRLRFFFHDDEYFQLTSR